MIGTKGAEDLYHDWHRVREIDEGGALLVRPDGYIAWRHSEAVWDDQTAFDLLQRATATMLR